MAQVTVLTNAGLALATNRITALGGNAPKYITWGTGAGTATVDRTTLLTEATETRTTGTITQQTTNVLNDTVQVVGRMTCNVTAKTITNAGLLDASAVGVLFILSSFDGIAMTQNDYIDFTFKAVAKMTT